jgi:hypothetical protein
MREVSARVLAKSEGIVLKRVSCSGQFLKSKLRTEGMGVPHAFHRNKQQAARCLGGFSFFLHHIYFLGVETLRGKKVIRYLP